MNTFEEFQVKSNELIEKIRELIQEGNARRIIIKQKNKIFLEIPVTVAGASLVLAPFLTALGLAAALFSNSTIEVIRKKD